jgi:hypothetical protein
MKTVRAKFIVVAKGVEGTVKLSAVYSSDPDHENTAFWNATPSGTIDMFITNKTAFAGFELGKEYYVDFTPVE